MTFRNEHFKIKRLARAISDDFSLWFYNVILSGQQYKIIVKMFCFLNDDKCRKMHLMKFASTEDSTIMWSKLKITDRAISWYVVF